MCLQQVAGASSDRWGYGAPTGQIGPSRSRVQRVCSCVTLSRRDQPIVRRDEEVLDARGGHHFGVGAAQEEQGWRRRVL